MDAGAFDQAGRGLSGLVAGLAGLGGDPLRLAAVFGVSEGTTIRYATNARTLL